MNIREFIRSSPQIKNELCYIIGKGPSLKNLKTIANPDANIITLNEAIVKIETLKLKNRIFSMQKDGASPHFINQCQCKIHKHALCPHGMVYPKKKKTILLVHELESIECLSDYSPRYTFSNADHGLAWFDFSALSAIQLAKELGAKKVIMVSFDAFTKKDLRSYNPANESYMDSTEYPGQYDRLSFLLGTIEHEFITPE